MRCLPSFIDEMGPAGGLGRRVCWSWRPRFGDSRICSFKFPCFLREGKKAVYKTDFEKGFIFFNQKEVAPTTSNVGFSSPSLFVVVLLLLLLTHIAHFPCGGHGCSKCVGAVTVRQDTSALPHAGRVLGWAMGQGSIPPATHILGPCTLHPAPET